MNNCIAILNQKYLIFEKEELDFTGYGGSTETHYQISFTNDINKASITSHKHWLHIIRWLRQPYNEKQVAFKSAKRTVKINTRFL